MSADSPAATAASRLSTARLQWRTTAAATQEYPDGNKAWNGCPVLGDAAARYRQDREGVFISRTGSMQIGGDQGARMEKNGYPSASGAARAVFGFRRFHATRAQDGAGSIALQSARAQVRSH